MSILIGTLSMVGRADLAEASPTSWPDVFRLRRFGQCGNGQKARSEAS
jgi:hypothetical protein